jgi:hypothetical protein
MVRDSEIETEQADDGADRLMHLLPALADKRH